MTAANLRRAALARFRKNNDVADLPDEAIERLGSYRVTLIKEHCRALAHEMKVNVVGTLWRFARWIRRP